ncbi:MAG TPA: 50S ribosomal protein L6 [Candidatus Aenigmarchaeota archaeon]|nr:50S ribosomal protein L6 [Candidatus Aenigmarchaeota archaeon]
MKREIDVPDGVEVRLEGNDLVVKGPKGELRRTFVNPQVKIAVSDNKITIVSDTERRRVKALVGTWASHSRNMIIGVTKGWMAKLKIVYSHFPIKFKVENNRIVVQNFLGERKDRVISINRDVKVELKKDEVIVTGINKEDVGQVAANIETMTKVKKFDRRVFQDGIHLVQKCTPIGNGE